MPVRGPDPSLLPGGGTGTTTQARPGSVDPGAYAFTLYRADGTSFELNPSTQMTVQAGVQGLDDPTLDIIEDTPAGWDGSLIESIAAEPREVYLPLLIKSTDLMSLRDAKQALTSYCNPARGPLTLRVAIPNGKGRLIDGYYRPVPGTMDTDTWGVSWQKLGIVLHCPQPFWRDENDWKIDWSYAAARSGPLPVLPLQPGASNTLNQINPVKVLGDVPTQPVWSITGPLDSVVITDIGTGATFTITADVGSGETWIVDTRRGRQGVLAPDGTRQRAKLNAGASFFALQPGLSQIETTVTGASAGAKVTGTAPQLYLAA